MRSIGDSGERGDLRSSDLGQKQTDYFAEMIMGEKNMIFLGRK